MVRLRPLKNPAVLRRVPQGRGIWGNAELPHAGGGYGGRPEAVVRVQAHEDPAVLRRYARYVVTTLDGFQARLLLKMVGLFYRAEKNRFYRRIFPLDGHLEINGNLWIV